MRTVVLIALIVPFTACSVPVQKTHPYAEANSLMQREIESRIAKFPYQHRQELLDNMLWLESKAGETAIPALLDVLHDKDPKVRSSALWVLGRIRDRRVIPQVRDLAADENEVVRLEAARTLVTMGDLKYLTILIEGLDSEKTPVRYHCHMALRDSTQKDFSYDHLDEDPDSRRRSVLKWREWWATQSSDPWFAASYAKEHGLETSIATPAPIGESQTNPKGNGTDTSTDPNTHTTTPGADTGQAVTGEHPAVRHPSQPGTTQPGTTQPGTTQPKAKDWAGPVQPQPTQPQPTQPQPTQPQPTQPPPTQPQPTQPKAQPEKTTTTPKPSGETEDKKDSSIFKLLDLSTPPKNDGSTGAGQSTTGTAKDAPKAPAGTTEAPTPTPQSTTPHTTTPPTPTPQATKPSTTSSGAKSPFKPLDLSSPTKKK